MNNNEFKNTDKKIEHQKSKNLIFENLIDAFRKKAKITIEQTANEMN